MLTSLLRFIGLLLYMWGLVYLTQRNCENPIQPDGAFIRSTPRIMNSMRRIAIPLLGLGAILGLGGVVPFGQIMGSLGDSSLFTFVLKPVIFLLNVFLTSIPSILIVFLLLRRMGLALSLPLRILLFFLLVAFLFVAGVLVLEQISAAGSIMIQMKDIRNYIWVLPLAMAALVPPLFLIHIIRHWSVELFPLGKEPVEDTDEQMSWSPEDRRLAAQYLIGFFTILPKPTHVVVNGNLKNRIKGHTFLGTGPGMVISELANIVAVRSSAGFKRFVGPGGEFISVKAADIPYEVMDLQKQFRVTRIEAMTRDGILISVPCSSMFKIDAGNKQFRIGKSWPYRERGAFLALHAAQEVNPAGKSFLDENDAVSWKELPLNTATPKLEQLVARYTLDELYATKKAFPLTTLPRKDITKELRSYVREKMDEVGIAILRGGVGAALIPKNERVVKQRVDTWKAGWAEKLEVQEGKASAVYLKESERVRVRILNELIELAHELGETSAENKRVLLAARLLEMLENIARNPEMERLLPEQRVGDVKEEERRILQDESGES